MTSKNNTAPLLHHVKLCASFQIHPWIQTKVIVRKRTIWVKIGDFFCPVWPWNLTDDLEKQFGTSSMLCASFCIHMWIQTGVTVRKLLNWVLTSVTMTFDPWPWPLARTSLLSMVITPENFVVMIRWQQHSEKGVTDWQTDRQTDGRTDG